MEGRAEELFAFSLNKVCMAGLVVTGDPGARQSRYYDSPLAGGRAGGQVNLHASSLNNCGLRNPFFFPPGAAVP